jgi:hypothetical protein
MDLGRQKSEKFRFLVLVVLVVYLRDNIKSSLAAAVFMLIFLVLKNQCCGSRIDFSFLGIRIRLLIKVIDTNL